LQHPSKPSEVLHNERLIETVLFTEEGDLFLAGGLSLAFELGDITSQIIAFWKLDDPKNQNADYQQGGNHYQHSADQKIEHSTPPQAALVPRRYRHLEMALVLSFHLGVRKPEGVGFVDAKICAGFPVIDTLLGHII